MHKIKRIFKVLVSLNVACIILTGCSRPPLVAVGYIAPGGGLNSKPISYFSQDNGKTWRLSSTNPPYQGEGKNIVKQVACVKDKCSAVGFYTPGGSGSPPHPISFFSHDGGKNWSFFTPPYRGTGESALNSVSCTSNHCVAVGYYTSLGLYRPLSYTSLNNGKTWVTSNTNPLYKGVGKNKLLGVSCTRNDCSSVGYFIPNGGDYTPISYISHDHGVNWSVSKTPPVYEGSGRNILFSVSCIKNNCSTVGHYAPNGNLKPSAPISYYSLDGGDNWLISTTPPPFKGPGENSLGSISCADRHCAAIGYYSTVSEHHPISYLSHDNGQNWTLSTTPPSYEGSGYNGLKSVICTKNICNAVGSYAPGGNGSPLHPINYRSTNYGETWSLPTTQPPYQEKGFSELFWVASGG